MILISDALMVELFLQFLSDGHHQWMRTLVLLSLHESSHSRVRVRMQVMLSGEQVFIQVGKNTLVRVGSSRTFCVRNAFAHQVVRSANVRIQIWCRFMIDYKKVNASTCWKLVLGGGRL
jgi:hypothetical protein